MDRLIAPNSVDAAHADTAPASGTPGFATDGNPATGVPATLWPGYQYNAIQEELIAFLTAAGITPDRTNNAQILAAVRALFAKINGDATQTFAVAVAAASSQAVPASQVVGVQQTLTNVTSSRALSTLFTNTTGKPIVLYVTATASAANNAIGGATAGIEGPISIASVAGGLVGVSYVVPVGQTYQILVTGSVTLTSWWELR